MKVTSQPVVSTPPPKSFTLILSQDEANYLRAILGNIAGRSDTNKVSKFSHELYLELVSHGARVENCPFSVDPKWGEMPD